MYIFQSWRKAIIHSTCMLFVGAGIASCGGGSTSEEQPGNSNLTKPDSTQQDTDYLAGQDAGLFLIAGSTGGPGSIDGLRDMARFNEPTGLAQGSNGAIIVADSQNHVLRKIDRTGLASTFAGKTAQPGDADGNARDARFAGLFALASDHAGNFYATDRHAIRKISSNGAVTTLAGTQGNSGSSDGSSAYARFNHPLGIAADRMGNVYVADTGNHAIRKITPAGQVLTLAGSPGDAGLSDGTATQARFNHPAGITLDANGDLYVADRDNHAIRKISAAGVVSTVRVAGNLAGHSAETQAPLYFDAPRAIAVDAKGMLYVTDALSVPQQEPCAGNGIVRKISTTGEIHTLAGTTKVCGSGDGMGTSARFNLPTGITLTPEGELLVADTYNHTIRKIDNAGLVSTFAGKARTHGYADGAGEQALFTNATGIAVDALRNLYVTDIGNAMNQSKALIRTISPVEGVRTLAGKIGTGYADGSAADARFDAPNSLTFDAYGNLYIADSNNAVIRKISADGWVTTVAGIPGNRGSIDGPGNMARFHYPTAITADRQGNLYVSDVYRAPDGMHSASIRKISANGFVSTLAGRIGESGHTDGMGSLARFMSPGGLAIDNEDNLYISDSLAHTIRRISSSGFVTTIAGSAGVSGDQDGSGSEARFNHPAGLTVDDHGNLFIADTFNHALRMVARDANVITVAGQKGREGIALGELPGGLHKPTGLAYLAPKLLAVTTGGSVIGVRMP